MSKGERDRAIESLEALLEWPSIGKEFGELTVLLRILKPISKERDMHEAEATNIKYRILAALRDCQDSWKKAGHKDEAAALRWWMAVTLAGDAAEFTIRDMAEDVESGLPGLPEDINSLIISLADEWTDLTEEEKDDELRGLVDFYGKNKE